MMKRWQAVGIACAGLAFAGFALSSCSTTQNAASSPPKVEGAHFVGNKVCYDCHTNMVRIFPASPHARFYKEDMKWAGVTGCESCHGAGSKHVEMGGGRGQFIVNPRKDPATCLECHIDVHAELNLSQHHPVLEGKMSCVQCHDPHGSDIFKRAGGLAMARLNQSCAECHREQSKPVVFEHEALREGCTVCHSPHGSPNRKMLVEPDPNLCLKCHSQLQGPAVPGGELFIGKVPHAAFLAQGTCWSAGCHTAIHGSNVNRLMLY